MQHWQPKRLQFPNEPKGISAALMIVGLAMVGSFGYGPAQDLIPPANAIVVEGRLVAYDRVHPLRADRVIPVYAWRTPDNAIQLVRGTRHRTTESGFPRTTPIRYVAGVPETARAQGQYTDLLPIVGGGFLLALIGLGIRLFAGRGE